MTRVRHVDARWQLVCLFFGVLAGSLANSQSLTPPANCHEPNRIEQYFPTNASPQSAQSGWVICWYTEPRYRYGLIITSAWFKRPGRGWLSVLGNTLLAEVYVPYHQPGLAFFDIGTPTFETLVLTENDCPSQVGGKLLPSVSPLVCREVGDGRNAWRLRSSGYRGERLSLWSIANAGNYNYIIMWTFRDDGTILGEVGSTGQTFPKRPTETHSHVFTWRIDVNLNRYDHNTASLVTHTDLPDGSAKDETRVIDSEQGISWDPARFNLLSISDPDLKNKDNKVSSYQLVPLRYGNIRTQQRYTQKDIWVTRYDRRQYSPPELPDYVSRGRSTVETDIIVWYTSGIHHMVRAEDGEVVGRTLRGVTPIMWTGFMLMPHNLFDKSPFYPPPAAVRSPTSKEVRKKQP